MQFCNSPPVALLLAYFVWSWSALLASATWWLLTVPPYNQRETRESYCDSLKYLSANQREFCDTYPTLMHKISDGVRLGIRECRHQFRYHRWNCTMYPGKPRQHAYAPILRTKGPEQAYVQAIIAASVSFEITKACTAGDLPDVCASKGRRSRSMESMEGHYIEDQSLSDDVEFGDSISRRFFADDKRTKRPDAVLAQHNSEAGRNAVRLSVRRICKCHGLSGACYVKACWDSMRPIRLISEQLKSKYDSAFPIRIKKNKIRRKKGKPKPTSNDLVYLKKKVPNDFCRQELNMGSYGTRGRLCNKTSSGVDGCDHLCCGRGFRVEHVTRTTSCNCTFIWCCQLDCQRCSETVTEHYCL